MISSYLDVIVHRTSTSNSASAETDAEARWIYPTRAEGQVLLNTCRGFQRSEQLVLGTMLVQLVRTIGRPTTTTTTMSTMAKWDFGSCFVLGLQYELSLSALEPDAGQSSARQCKMHIFHTMFVMCQSVYIHGLRLCLSRSQA